MRKLNVKEMKSVTAGTIGIVGRRSPLSRTLSRTLRRAELAGEVLGREARRYQ